MDNDKNKRYARLSWVFVGVLVLLLAVLGVLQYRWIGEVTVAERQRLRTSLQASLQRLSQDFNAELNTAIAGLIPYPAQFEELERLEAYAAIYQQWKSSTPHGRFFKRVAVAVPEKDTIDLYVLNPSTAEYENQPWPKDWSDLHQRMLSRIGEGPGPPRMGGPMSATETNLIEMPRFNRPEPGRLFTRGGRDRGDMRPPMAPRVRELDWFIAEVDPAYVAASMLPELLTRHFGAQGKQQYQVELVLREFPDRFLFPASSKPANAIGPNADASITLFDVAFDQVMRRLGMFRGRDGGGRGRGNGPPQFMQPPDRGRWLLSVRHTAGSLEAVVNQTRLRNLAVTSGILLLMLAAIAALVQFTHRAQKLAEVQMEFVASVSHELRTPLAVIRTAAHNLKGGVVSNTKQVQRYGTLIVGEAERLTTIVEQVLRFANAKAGRTIAQPSPADIRTLVEETIASTATVLDDSHCQVETRIEDNLPPVLADSNALKHAIQNLLTNAAKYGCEGGWIGVTVSSPDDSTVEIKVADRGPGIPQEERNQIFDPFFRGRRAVDDQIHGTGLGLNLVKRIVDAHKGSVAVHSEPGKGTEFVLRIPTVPAEQRDEFAHSVS
ncbi:MAG: HAMP domain-containing histidine kinase [Bryobacterales bacterium]|nr:HAMP domain-containing histidine kinase [Bryobacterales bacterium]